MTVACHLILNKIKYVYTLQWHLSLRTLSLECICSRESPSLPRNIHTYIHTRRHTHHESNKIVRCRTVLRLSSTFRDHCDTSGVRSKSLLLLMLLLLLMMMRSSEGVESSPPCKSQCRCYGPTPSSSLMRRTERCSKSKRSEYWGGSKFWSKCVYLSILLEHTTHECHSVLFSRRIVYVGFDAEWCW